VFRAGNRRLRLAEHSAQVVLKKLSSNPIRKNTDAIGQGRMRTEMHAITCLIVSFHIDDPRTRGWLDNLYWDTELDR
jgi:hypothetical protein